MNAEPIRKRGRPRSLQADAAIQSAVIELLDGVGYTGLRVDDVAERAGVSKTTIYRRWPTKAALVVDVLRALKAEQIPMPETGDFEEDLRLLVYELFGSVNSTPLARALPGLLAEKSADAELSEAIEQLWTARQALVAGVLRRGVASGQARADLDVTATVDMLAGPAYYRLLITGKPLDRRSAKRHADALVSFTRAAQN